MVINNQRIIKKGVKVPYTIKELNESSYAIHARNISLMIADRLGGESNPYDVAYIAYLFYKLATSNSPRFDSACPLEDIARIQLNRFLSGEIQLNAYILSSINEYIKNGFIKSYKIYEDVGNNPNNYAAIILFDIYSDIKQNRMISEFSTPNDLVRLSQALLEIKDGDRVADICCGSGNFLTNAISDNPNAKYSGYEININCATLLAMKMDILGANPNIVMGDIGNTLSNNDIVFDKIFSNYPLGIRLDRHVGLLEKIPFSVGHNSGDWYFNSIIVDHLSENGKAVAISTLGSTWNRTTTNERARKYFIDNGLIESVIILPDGVIPGTAVSTVAYIFSHNNTNVRLVDAGKILEKNHNDSSLTEEKVSEILSLLDSDSDRSISISNDKIAERGYSLAFKTYKSGLTKYKNGTPLSEVAEIMRGTINPKDSITDKYTGKYLLQISDLENGTIKKNLDEDHQLNPEKLSLSQRLLPYDLLITRSAQPVKVAIVSPNEERELYPNGNMFVVRMKGTDVNPYYLLSFLLSRDGQEALDFATTGSVLKTISAASLSELIFPLKGLNEQCAIAERISEYIAQYQAYLLKAEMARSNIENSYYEAEDNCA